MLWPQTFSEEIAGKEALDSDYIKGDSVATRKFANFGIREFPNYQAMG